MSNIRSITFAEYEKCIHKVESQLDFTEAFISFMEVSSKGRKSIVSPLKDSNNG